MNAKTCMALLTLAGTQLACQPTPTLVSPDSQDTQTPVTMAPTGNASTIVLDPATSEPTDDPAIIRAESVGFAVPETLRTPASQLETIIGDDGSVSITLDDTYQTSLVATIDCDGNMRTTHSDNPAADHAAEDDCGDAK